MESYPNVLELVRARQPELPVLAMRLHMPVRAARFFVQHFPGDVLYAVKANSDPRVIAAVVKGGLQHVDVASMGEIEAVASQFPQLKLHLMNTVKSRRTIDRAYHEFGIRTFSLDSEAELEKILEETNRARDLTLMVRLFHKGGDSVFPLATKFGIHGAPAVRLLQRARKVAAELGICFHVGSQVMDKGSYAAAIAAAAEHAREAGVRIDVLDVGGGFPWRYPGYDPEPLEAYIEAIIDAVAASPFHSARLMCEPGRGLSADAESAILRVDARRDRHLYLNDGAFGMLFDAAKYDFVYPAQLVTADGRASDPAEEFSLFGPSCDSVDLAKGPFRLPGSIREGDYIEFGGMGAYGRVLTSHFNGFGQYDEALLTDEPMMTMFPAREAPAPIVLRRFDRVARGGADLWPAGAWAAETPLPPAERPAAPLRPPIGMDADTTEMFRRWWKMQGHRL